MSLRMEAGFEHLREAMGDVLAREVEFAPGVLVTVLDAKMTANTAHAKFVLSVFPESAQELVTEKLREYDAEIKEGLGKSLRLRRIPRLHYSFDDTEAEAAVIENQLLELRRKGEV